MAEGGEQEEKESGYRQISQHGSLPVVVTWNEIMLFRPKSGSRTESFGLVYIPNLPPPPDGRQLFIYHTSNFEAKKKPKLRILEGYLEKTSRAGGLPGESKLPDPLAPARAATGNSCYSNCNRKLWIWG